MLLLTVALLLSPKALAWDNHQTILEKMFDTKSAKRRLYPYKKMKIPCPEDEKRELQVVGKDLHIDISKVPIFSAKYCKPGDTSAEILLSDMLTSGVVDEPDLGMDQNLPEAEDPHHFRKWMGGETGPTSQGFRHMFFPGFSIIHPIKTLQLPLGATGDGLERVAKLRDAAETYFSRGDKFWGTRILLWEAHYIQDLHQPFHVIQVPSPKMVPWKSIFSGFNKASTHAIGNYHYAYEGLVLAMLKEAQTNDFQACLEQPSDGAKFHEPEELIQLPRELGNELGNELYALFGDAPKSPEMDLPNGIGQIDYFAILHTPEPAVLPQDEIKELSKDEHESFKRAQVQWQALANVKRITCQLMGSVSRYTWNEFDRSYLKEVESAKSAK